MGWPQITVIVLMALGVGMALCLHGAPRGPNHAPTYVAGEKLMAVADAMGKDWKVLRSAWARRVQAGKRPKPEYPKTRDCMTCAKPFKSEGPGNRLCAGCTGKSAVGA